jgi:hypothetical protein
MIMTAAMVAVSIGYAAYTPKHLDVVAGDTVQWSQDSVRKHTVTALDGSFDSGTLLTGDTYERAFPVLGTYGYYCRLHAGIVGEVQVHDVVLDPVGTAASAGRAFPLHGRTAPGVRTVTVTGDDGSSVTATPGEDGAFAASVVPRTTTTYSAGDSAPVTLRVLDRSVAVHVAPHGRRWSVVAVVSPASPRGTVVLQLRLKERFGWWPVTSGRLGPDSATTLHAGHARRVAARVVYTLPDRATPLAVSRTFHLGLPGPTARAGRP